MCSPFPVSKQNSDLDKKPSWNMPGYKFIFSSNGVSNGTNSFVPSINGKELTISNCAAIFPVCPQVGANIIAYNGNVNANGQWVIHLNVVPGGVCTFYYLAIVIKSDF